MKNIISIILVLSITLPAEAAKKAPPRVVWSGMADAEPSKDGRGPAQTGRRPQVRRQQPVRTRPAPAAPAAGSTGLVEDFGSNGLLGGTDVIDRAEGFMGGSYHCNSASREEFNAIDCVVGWDITNSQNITDFDNWSEELVFMEAAQRTHQMTQCQVKLHDQYETNSLTSTTMKQNAFIQFQDIRSQLGLIIRERDGVSAELSTARNASNYYEDRMSGTLNQTYGYEREVAAKLADVNSRLNSLMARVPMGNRVQMREMLVGLAGRPGVSEQQFYAAYEGVMRQLGSEARQSQNFFNGILRSVPGREAGQSGQAYQVNEDLKKSLVKSGQIENVVESLGLSESLSRGFSCRIRARYENGPTTLAIAEIPLYFLGVYGLGRLAVRAGVGVIRATSAAARTTAQITAWSARAAMLGLEGYTWARIGDATREACFPPEYLTAVQNDAGCTAESEVNGVYQNASIAQCLTAATLAVAPVAFVGAVRVWRRGATRAVPEGIVTARVADEVPVANISRVVDEVPPVTTVDEIVVTAPRRRTNPNITPERAPGAEAWRSVNDVSRVNGLAAADKVHLQGYMRSLPANVQVRLRNHFRGQSPQQTLKDLQDMRDLSRINSCR